MTQYIRGKSVYETHPAESKLFVDIDENEEIDSGQPYWIIKENDGITIGVLNQGFFKIDCSGNFTINDIVQGDIFYVAANGNIVRLATGTDGYQLTTHGAGNIPTWGTPTYGSIADLIFEERICIKCNKRFKIGDNIVLKVIEFDEDGNTATVPMHEQCMRLPLQKIIIKREIKEDYWYWDYEKGMKKRKRIPKMIKKTTEKKELKKGYTIHPETGNFMFAGRVVDMEEATVITKVEMSEKIYEIKEFIIK